MYWLLKRIASILLINPLALLKLPTPVDNFKWIIYEVILFVIYRSILLEY